MALSSLPTVSPFDSISVRDFPGQSGESSYRSARRSRRSSNSSDARPRPGRSTHHDSNILTENNLKRLGTPRPKSFSEHMFAWENEVRNEQQVRNVPTTEESQQPRSRNASVKSRQVPTRRSSSTRDVRSGARATESNHRTTGSSHKLPYTSGEVTGSNSNGKVRALTGSRGGPPPAPSARQSARLSLSSKTPNGVVPLHDSGDLAATQSSGDEGRGSSRTSRGERSGSIHKRQIVVDSELRESLQVDRPDQYTLREYHFPSQPTREITIHWT